MKTFATEGNHTDLFAVEASISPVSNASPAQTDNASANPDSYKNQSSWNTAYKNRKWFFRRYQSFISAFMLFIIIGGILQIGIGSVNLFLLVNQHYCSFLDVFFEIYTYLGDGLTVVFVALLLSLRRIRYGVLVGISYLYTSLIVQILKNYFHFPRPVKYFAGHISIRVIEGYNVHSFKSFPSGHSMSAMVLAVVFAYLIPNKRYSWLVFLIFSLVAFSRMYLAQHFFLDIYAGVILGVLLTFQVIWWLEGKRWYHSDFLNRRLFGKD